MSGSTPSCSAGVRYTHTWPRLWDSFHFSIISGEFSVGVSGLLVEKGKLDKPVKAAMISGNLLELLGRMDAVADDLTFYGSMAAPTFRVADMTVA